MTKCNSPHKIITLMGMTPLKEVKKGVKKIKDKKRLIKKKEVGKRSTHPLKWLNHRVNNSLFFFQCFLFVFVLPWLGSFTNTRRHVTDKSLQLLQYNVVPAPLSRSMAKPTHLWSYAAAPPPPKPTALLQYKIKILSKDINNAAKDQSTTCMALVFTDNHIQRAGNISH